MLDLSTMTQHPTLEGWVLTWPEEDRRAIAEDGYDEWTGRPENRDVRTIYLAFKHSIWSLLRDASEGDVTGYLFDELGYMANTEQEFFDVLLGTAIEEAVARTETTEARG